MPHSIISHLSKGGEAFPVGCDGIKSLKFVLPSISDDVTGRCDWANGPRLVGRMLGQGGDGDFLTNFLSNPLILPVGLLLIFYLTFIAPERRRRAEEAKMMAALKKNDRVVTIGGIHATVVSVSPDSDVVTLKIDEGSNTRIKVNRTAIARIMNGSKEKKSETKEPAGSSAERR